MTDLSNVPTTVSAITSVVNARQARSLLTDNNFEVLEVTPYLSEQAVANTAVKVRVDLYPNTTLPVVDTDRYSIRVVHCCRVDLREAGKLAGLPHNEKGRVIVSTIADLDSIIAAIADKINISPNEVTLGIVDEKTKVLVAKKDSLGYTGSLTVTLAEEEPAV